MSTRAIRNLRVFTYSSMLGVAAALTCVASVAAAEPYGPLPPSTWYSLNDGIFRGIVGSEPSTNPARPGDNRLRKTGTTGEFAHLVKITFGAGGITNGTGVIVGPRHILTAAHNLWNRGNKTLYTNITLKLQKGGTPAIKTIYIPQAWKNLDADAESMPNGYPPGAYNKYDYALIVTTTAIASGTASGGGFMDVTLLNVPDSWYSERQITVAGYPGATLACKGGVATANQKYFPPLLGTCSGYLYAAYGLIKNATYNTDQFQHDADAQQGQSGGPLYVRPNVETAPNWRVVVGLHTLITPGYGNFAVRLNAENIPIIKGWIAAP